MLKQLAPQVRQPKQQQPDDVVWPSLAVSNNSAAGQEPRRDVQETQEPSQPMRQDWNQTNSRKNSRQKKDWSRAGKQKDSGWRYRPEMQQGGNNVQGPNVQGGYGPPPNIRPVHPPGLDVSGRPYFPPLNYGLVSHPTQAEGRGMGMWNRAPIHPRGNHMDMAGYGMGSAPGLRPGSNPYEMGFAQQRWPGQDYMPGKERPHPHLHPQNGPPMPRPPVPMQGAYVLPVIPAMPPYRVGTVVDPEQVRRSNSSNVDPKRFEQLGYPAYPVSHSYSAGAMPQSYSTNAAPHSSAMMSHSHSSSPALQTVPNSHSPSVLPHSHSTSSMAHSHSTDDSTRRKLILLRGLPGSGKTTLAKYVLHILGGRPWNKARIMGNSTF